MATRALVMTDQNMRSVTVTWSGVLNGDDGAPVEYADFADRSVQVQGTLGAGGNLRWEGSNDGTNYVVLTDPQGNALNFVAVSTLEQVEELTRFMRPRATAGDGTTNFTVTMYGVRRM